MGAAVAEAVDADVAWASEGRSDATRKRADQVGLTDLGTVAALVESSDVVLSICPPALAEEVAEHVFGLGFDGLFVEANAISPARMRRLAELGRIVDGSIVAATGINLYLAGDGAEDVASLFAGSKVEAVVLDAPVGAASALKMAFGGWNKIGIALTAQAHAIARAYGVGDRLEAEGVAADRLPRAGGRAWRWAPEMEEVAATCLELGLPDGIARGAADAFRRWEQHRDTRVELDRLLDDLSG